MNRPSRPKGIWIVVAAAVLAVVTFVVSSLMGGSANPISGALGVITTPLRSAVSSIANWVENRYDYAFRYDALVEENEQLKQRVAELEALNRDSADAIEENEILRDILGLDQKRKDFVWELATVTARGATNWASTLTLNKGSHHGVSEGNCVVDRYGNLVGIVDEVSVNWCTVITVIDPELEMGALVARTNSAAILEGDFTLMGQGKLKLSYLPETTLLLSGDEVMTSGMGGVYPSGLKVATIDEIRTEASGMGRYAVLSPAADLDELRQAFIITQFDIVD